MKTEIKFTEDYVLLLDKENEVKSKDYILEEGKIYLLNNNSFMTGTKILAYKKLNPEAPDLDLPLLPDWESEYSVIQIIDMLLNVCKASYPQFEDWIEYKETIKFRELNKDKQFTLEDIGKTIDLAQQLCDQNAHYVSRDRNVYVPMITVDEQEQIIQQLQKPKLPKEFIPEFEYQTREGYWKSVLLPSEWFGSDEGDNPKRIYIKNNVVQGTWKF